MTTQIETINFGGWPNCRRLSDGVVEVVVTTDVGPRLVRFGFVGGANEFREYPDLQGLTGGDEWRMYGGHRFWHAPEDLARTYQPDNAPAAVEPLPDGLRFVQPVEAATGLQKEIDVQMGPGAGHVRVTHRLRNLGLWTVETAPWALSVMAMGGTAIIPLPPRGSHPENLLPASHLVLWAYTDMSDPRWSWGQKYLLLRQDPQAQNPQKLGASVPAGWTAYARDGRLFVKRFTYVPGAEYPDLGCSVETFTDATMLELETLGPLVHLAPQAAVEHVEDWYLFDGVPMPGSDAEVETNVLPKVGEAGAGAMRISRIIKAPRPKVYQAFLNPEAVAAWLAPDNMQGHVHSFEPREGGQFRLSLQYLNPEDAQSGKTTGDTDTYHGHFAQLVPNEKIVEVIEFESDDPGFAGAMIMTVLLADAAGGTEVTLLYENVPSGIRPEDNEAGSRSSLQKLAALLE